MGIVEQRGIVVYIQLSWSTKLDTTIWLLLAKQEPKTSCECTAIAIDTLRRTIAESEELLLSITIVQQVSGFLLTLASGSGESKFAYLQQQ